MLSSELQTVIELPQRSVAILRIGLELESNPDHAGQTFSNQLIIKADDLSNNSPFAIRGGMLLNVLALPRTTSWATLPDSGSTCPIPRSSWNELEGNDDRDLVLSTDLPQVPASVVVVVVALSFLMVTAGLCGCLSATFRKLDDDGRCNVDA